MARIISKFVQYVKIFRLTFAKIRIWHFVNKKTLILFYLRDERLAWLQLLSINYKKTRSRPISR
jgi:hypothetical protein